MTPPLCSGVGGAHRPLSTSPSPSLEPPPSAGAHRPLTPRVPSLPLLSRRTAGASPAGVRLVQCTQVGVREWYPAGGHAAAGPAGQWADCHPRSSGGRPGVARPPGPSLRPAAGYES